MGIQDELAELAREAGAGEREAGPATEFLNGNNLFAVVAGDSVEMRVGPDIAEAARRTPDTSASSRGDDWITFSPRVWDDHARDRLEAWFRVAWRRAERPR